MNDPVWTVCDRLARLEIGPFRGAIDLARPEHGLRLALPPSEQPGHSVLGVVFPHPSRDELAVDAYVRGHDLVATYDETPARPFRVQIYWRGVDNALAECAAARAVEVQVSVQTALLDCRPGVFTCSTIRTTADVERVEAGGIPLSSSTRFPRSVLFDLPLGAEPNRWRYVEMIHAADTRHDRATHSDAAWTLEHDLFDPGLEKGVILRVRVRGVLYPGGFDADLARSAYQAFHATPLPLTA